MRELEKVLDKDEKVFWEGQPKFWPFVLGGGSVAFIFGIIWMAFLVPFFIPLIFAGTATSAMTINGVPIKGMDSMALIMFVLFGGGCMLLPFLIIGLGMMFGVPVYQFLVYKNMYYAITNKRVIVQGGVVGRDFQFIDFDQITNAEVNVGFWDKLVGKNSGSILLSSAGTFVGYSNRHGSNVAARPYTLSNIENPYEVFKLFKDIGHAVKTDIQYPNKFRPSDNPGYKSEYKPKDEEKK